SVRTRLMGTSDWSEEVSLQLNAEQITARQISFNVPLVDSKGEKIAPKRWNVGDPNLYEIEISLTVELNSGHTGTDTVVTRAAFRKIETVGKQLVLNGKPLIVRGLLNWGYTGRSTSPSIQESYMLDEID